MTFPAQFPALLNGQESQRCVDLRKQLFLSSWKRVETEIEVRMAMPFIHLNTKLIVSTEHRFSRQPDDIRCYCRFY